MAQALQFTSINTRPGDDHALIEREAELRLVSQLADTVVGGHGSAVFIVGPAGIGKTSVLRAGLRVAEDSGFAVAIAGASPMESHLPFGLFDQARRALSATGWFEPGDPVQATDKAERVFATLRSLATAAERRPLLLALDDLQWADGDSLDQLGFVCRRLKGLRIGVLACLRPDAEQAGPLVRELVACGYARLVRLGGLSRTGALQLIARTAERPIDDALGERLWRACAGTPLLLEAATWALDERGGLPQSPAGGEFARTLLIERFVGAGREALRYVQAGAILGIRFQPKVAAALAGLTEDLAEAAHARLVRAQLLEDQTGGWSTFVHPLFAQAVLESMPTSVRERRQALAFRLLVELGAPDAVLLDYASGLVAGVRFEDADRICVRLLEGAELAAGEQARGLAVRARVAMLRDRPADAERLYEQAAAVAAQAGPAGGSAVLINALAGSHFASPVSWTLGAANRALGDLPQGDAARPALELLAVLVRLEGGDAAAEPLVARAVQSWRESTAHDPDGPDPNAGTNAVNALKLLEDYEGAGAVFEREFDLTLSAGAPIATVALAVAYSDALCRAGRPAAAVELVRRAVALTDWGTPRSTDLAIVVGLLELGCDDQAAPLIGQLRELTASASPSHYGIVALWLDVIDARTHLSAGDPVRASDAMAHAAETAELTGWLHPCVVPWAGVAIEAHLAAGRLERACRLIDELDDLAEPLSCGWPRAVAALGRAQLSAAAGDMEEADRLFAVALPLFAALPMPIAYAEALVARGSHLRRTGRPRESRRPLSVALALCEEAGTERVARLARAELAASGGRRRRRGHDPDQLTAQERRVAALAADGLTNAQIAAALYLSPKTVGHHLGRVYSKLGVSSRHKLGRLLDDGRLSSVRATHSGHHEEAKDGVAARC